MNTIYSRPQFALTQRVLSVLASVACALAIWLASAPIAVAAPDPPPPTNASNSAVCEAIGSGQDCNENAHGSADVNGVIKLIINLLSTLIGVVAVIMIIVASFKFVTSSGDSGKVSSAKSTLIYALIGLVLVALAQIIVRFVLGRVTK